VKPCEAGATKLLFHRGKSKEAEVIRQKAKVKSLPCETLRSRSNEVAVS